MPRRPRTEVVSKKEVGARLRALRDEHGLSQTDLAKTLGTTQSHVSGLEHGTRSLTIHQVVKLARALHTTTDALLLGHTKRTAAPNGHLPSRRVLRRLEKIEKLAKRDKQALFATIDKFLSGID